ncbi:hypothetical protein BU24DRAFT_157658 [Aaosphaeria arxii CBS 175.79]|uniref:Uncharacterized protein n=1 Tax=Aaosphaeria arxii CBS 175.79 TaxID=1450172 RepID=A0A6A5XYP0_9PLEO|nr:uncharacterized protein BU24DRAFT_157658 [Aaosphaeria arxii CBS 175.79]KAF2017750.1 hypothetical protein BU24DRAFT_157658 [Aaosphaeria arxii CBS 175.79]
MQGCKTKLINKNTQKQEGKSHADAMHTQCRQTDAHSIFLDHMKSTSPLQKPLIPIPPSSTVPPTTEPQPPSVSIEARQSPSPSLSRPIQTDLSRKEDQSRYTK